MSRVSIIIATFNSQKTLPSVLKSIKSQTYPRQSVEVIVVDGGSSDGTLTIAKTYGCRIIRNPNVEPVYARYLGFKAAKGEYVMFLDHDEELLNSRSIEIKVRTLQKNVHVKAVIGSGYRSPEGYPVINRYINEYGDPFSYFMYKLTKHADYFIPIMRKRYKTVAETDDVIEFDLSRRTGVPIIELVAAGSMIDAMYFKREFPQLLKNYYLIPHLLQILMKVNSRLAVVKDDDIMHYSSETFMGYIPKLIWRIKNNIFFKESTGFSGFIGRSRYENRLFQIKKYLFPLYALFILFPAIDSVILIIRRRDMSYIIHLVLTVLTAVLILYYTIVKMFGRTPVFTSYDGTVRAYENS